MTQTGLRNYYEANAAGLKMVGEWGFPGKHGGGIWALPGNVDSVLAAYGAIEEGDLGPDVLADVFAAGGIFVPDGGE